MENPKTQKKTSQQAPPLPPPSLDLLSTPRSEVNNEEKVTSQELKHLLSSLPKEKGLIYAAINDIYQYRGFWFPPKVLQAMFDFEQQLHPLHTDILLVTPPKSGTTWLKALVFALVNRSVHHPQDHDHPLLTKNPHDVVKFFFFLKPSDYSLSSSLIPTRRIFATHNPFITLPESVKAESSPCKIVYMCRGIKDTFVSLYHFVNKIRPSNTMSYSLEEAFDFFAAGRNFCGPIWDQILGYWQESLLRPKSVLFIKYEDMKKQPHFELSRLADFLECPFSVEEESEGLVQQILKLCSFDHLNKLEVNKTGKMFGSSKGKNSAFFRKGEIGDWKNYLTTEMANKLDNITHQKFHDFGLYDLD